MGKREKSGLHEDPDSPEVHHHASVQSVQSLAEGGEVKQYAQDVEHAVDGELGNGVEEGALQRSAAGEDDAEDEEVVQEAQVGVHLEAPLAALLLATEFADEQGDRHEKQDDDAGEQVHTGEVHVGVEEGVGLGRGVAHVGELAAEDGVEEGEVGVHEAGAVLDVLHEGGEEQEGADLEGEHVWNDVAGVERLGHREQSLDGILDEEQHHEEDANDRENEVTVIFNVTCVELGPIEIVGDGEST